MRRGPKKKPLTEALEKIYSDPEECMAAASALAKKAQKGYETGRSAIGDGSGHDEHDRRELTI